MSEIITFPQSFEIKGDLNPELFPKAYDGSQRPQHDTDGYIILLNLNTDRYKPAHGYIYTEIEDVLYVKYATMKNVHSEFLRDAGLKNLLDEEDFFVDKPDIINYYGIYDKEEQKFFPLVVYGEYINADMSHFTETVGFMTHINSFCEDKLRDQFVELMDNTDSRVVSNITVHKFIDNIDNFLKLIYTSDAGEGYVFSTSEKNTFTDIKFTLLVKKENDKNEV